MFYLNLNKNNHKGPIMSSKFGKLFDAEMEQYKIKVHYESISAQLNDEFCNKLITQCTDMILLSKANKTRELRLVLSELERDIPTRFGFNIKFVEDETMSNIGTWPITLKPNHIYLTAMGQDQWLDQLLDEIQESGTNITNSVENLNRIRWEEPEPTTNEDEDDQPKATSDYMAMYKQYISNMKIGLSKSGLGNVTIDLDKAFVNGLDKEIYGIVILNIPRIVKDIPDIQPEELAALILHEIGHNFTSIEITKDNINNNLTLITTLKDVCAINGKPLKRGLIRAYESITGNVVPNPMNVSDRDVALSLIEWVAKKNNLTTNKTSLINSESQADVFVSRFGLGGSLSSVITKMKAKEGGTTYAILNGAGATLVLFSVFALFSVIAIIIKTMLMLGVFSMLIMAYFSGMISMIIAYNFISPDLKPTGENYDKFKMRLQKIKNDSIRILRTTKLDAKTKAWLIEDIEKTIKLIDKAPRPSEGAFIWLWRKISRGAQTIFDMKRTEELWESLQENDLYLAKTKLDAVINTTGVNK